MSYSDDEQDQGSASTVGESSNVNTSQDTDKSNLTVPLTPKSVKMTTSSSLSTSIHIPEAMKLKGEENWIQWKEKIISITKASDIYKYIHPKAMLAKPEFVDEYDDDSKATLAQLLAWKEWDKGDAQMQLALTYNCKPIPAELI
jgi:hypothetical protein